MQKFLWLFAVLALAVACTSQEKQQTTQAHHEEPEEEALAEAAAEAGESDYPADSLGEDGRSFHGYRIAATDAVPATQLSGLMASDGPLDPVKVSGDVNAACQMKGCWMTMQLDEETEMRVRFKDYGFFVPKDCSGKTAIVEGKAFYDTTSVEMLRHYAVDGGMSEEEAEKTYTEPEVAIAFEATGVIIQ